MTSKIHPLFPCSATNATAIAIAIAIVLEAYHGQAMVVTRDGTPCPVAGHLSQVEALQPGDRVLTIRTDIGIIVTGRLRGSDESPTPRIEEQDGYLIVEATRGVRLKAGDNRIEVHADGRIALNGKQVAVMATDRARILGQTIELGEPS